MRLQARSGVPGSLVRVSPVGGDFWQPMVSPSGKSVIFWGQANGVPGYHIWMTRLADHANPVQLTHGPGINGHPAWFPDEERVVFFSTIAAGGDPSWQHSRQFSADRQGAALCVLNLRTGGVTQLTGRDCLHERPAVSSDSETLVCVSNRSGTLNLWRMNVDGSGAVKLTTTTGLEYRPAFSSDGRRFAYFAEDDDGSHQLRVTSWPEMQPIGLPSSPEFRWVHGPCWGNDGRTLLVHGLRLGHERPRLWLFDTQGGGLELLSLPGVDTCSHGSWNLAEDVVAFDARV